MHFLAEKKEMLTYYTINKVKSNDLNHLFLDDSYRQQLLNNRLRISSSIKFSGKLYSVLKARFKNVPDDRFFSVNEAIKIALRNFSDL